MFTGAWIVYIALFQLIYGCGVLGVVVESFSYVTQLSGARSIGREDMRVFKKVWAEFCDPDSGRLVAKDFTNFFAVRCLHLDCFQAANKSDSV